MPRSKGRGPNSSKSHKNWATARSQRLEIVKRRRVKGRAKKRRA